MGRRYRRQKLLQTLIVNNFFPAKTIANAAGICIETARARARRKRWPLRWQGKRVKYRPPYRLQKMIKPAFDEQRILRECLRAAAVAGFLLEMRRNARVGIEQALEVTASKYRHLFKFAPRALRRWVSLVQRGGVAALQEHKAGVVGRKPMRLEGILR